MASSCVYFPYKTNKRHAVTITTILHIWNWRLDRNSTKVPYFKYALKCSRVWNWNRIFAIRLSTKMLTKSWKAVGSPKIISIIIKWKHFPRYWSFVRGIHRSPVNSPHKGHWRGALMFSKICAWIKGWVNNREAGDYRRHRAYYDVIVMLN